MAYRLSGHLIDLGRRKAHRDHLVNSRHHPENTNTIGDKIRPVFCRHDAFPKPLIEKSRKLACHHTIGPFGRDDLDQLHIPWRIKEMHADKMLLEIVRKRLGDRFNRNTARIGSYHRTGLAIFIYFGKNLVLYLKILDNRFNDQIAILKLRHVVGKIAGRDQVRILTQHIRRRTCLFQAVVARLCYTVLDLRRINRQSFCRLFRRQFARCNVQ